jgi:hypothetical protein
MVWPRDQSPVYGRSRYGCWTQFLVKVDDHSALIVDDPQGILGQQLKPRLSPLLNIIIIIIVNYFKSLNYNIIFKLIAGNYKGRNRSVSAIKIRKRIKFENLITLASFTGDFV